MTERRDVLDFLDDIAVAMAAALEFIEGMDAQAFCTDRKTSFVSPPRYWLRWTIVFIVIAAVGQTLVSLSTEQLVRG